MNIARMRSSSPPPAPVVVALVLLCAAFVGASGDATEYTPELLAHSGVIQVSASDLLLAPLGAGEAALPAGNGTVSVLGLAMAVSTLASSLSSLESTAASTQMSLEAANVDLKERVSSLESTQSLLSTAVSSPLLSMTVSQLGVSQAAMSQLLSSTVNFTEQLSTEQSSLSALVSDLDPEVSEISALRSAEMLQLNATLRTLAGAIDDNALGIEVNEADIDELFFITRDQRVSFEASDYANHFSIAVINNAGRSFTDYDLKLEIDKSLLDSSAPGCADVRVAAEHAPDEALPSHVHAETCSGEGSLVLFVRVPVIPQSHLTLTLHSGYNDAENIFLAAPDFFKGIYSGLLMAWDMDEPTSNLIAVDTSGNGFNGAHINPMQGSLSPFGKQSHRYVSGVETYTYVEGNRPEWYTRFAISLWMKTSAADSGYWYSESSPTNGGCWRIGHSVNSGHLSLYFYDNSNDPPTRHFVSSRYIADGKWHHVVYMMEKGSLFEEIRLYIDGVLDMSADSLASEQWYSRFWIGGTWGGCLGDTTFDGDLAHLRFFDRHLTPEEIRHLHQYNSFSMDGSEFVVNSDSRVTHTISAA